MNKKPSASNCRTYHFFCAQLSCSQMDAILDP